MSVFVTVRCITGLIIDWFILTLYVALITFNISMFSIQLKPCIFRRIVIKLRWFPACSCMTWLACLIRELLFMSVWMTGWWVTGFIRHPPKLIVLMTFFTAYLNMFICKRIVCLGMVNLYLLPALSCMTLCTLGLTLMYIIMTGYTLFKFFNLILILWMALFTLYINMFSCNNIFGVSIMAKFIYILPSCKLVTPSAVLT